VDAPAVHLRRLCSPGVQKELEKERAWLATLNQNQAPLDQGEPELKALQRQLYATWWKHGFQQ
jgi:hypothetical protein